MELAEIYGNSYNDRRRILSEAMEALVQIHGSGRKAALASGVPQSSWVEFGTKQADPGKMSLVYVAAIAIALDRNPGEFAAELIGRPIDLAYIVSRQPRAIQQKVLAAIAVSLSDP